MSFKVFISIVAPILTITSFLPQLAKTMRSKQTRDLSLPTFVVLACSATLWTVYGITERDVAIIITNAAVTTFGLIIIYYKLRYK